MTRLVLSPFVATTTASASSIPARCRTSVSMPWPTTNPPGQSVPRRVKASSRSSTTLMSHPSWWSCNAMADPTLPQPITTAFTPSAYALQDPLGERHDEHLAGRVAQDVVDRRREEETLSAPARRGAEHDQVDPARSRLLDDRVADRARLHGLRPHLDSVLL